MENAKLKQISSYEENISMRKELTRVRILILNNLKILLSLNKLINDLIIFFPI